MSSETRPCASEPARRLPHPPDRTAARFPAQKHLEPLFAALDADAADAIDAVRDARNMPLSGEPVQVREDLLALSAR
jgi:hypothetical protein